MGLAVNADAFTAPSQRGNECYWCQLAEPCDCGDGPCKCSCGECQTAPDGMSWELFAESWRRAMADPRPWLVTSIWRGRREPFARFPTEKMALLAASRIPSRLDPIVEYRPTGRKQRAVNAKAQPERSTDQPKKESPS